MQPRVIVREVLKCYIEIEINKVIENDQVKELEMMTC